MRRFAMLAMSFSLMLGLSSSLLLAQDAVKKDAPADAPKADAPKADAPKADAPKADAPKEEPKKEEPKKEEPLLPIPPEVEKKLDAARRAVAEAIVAAQDAGLVKSSIDPPPILDILITGRATDEATLKARTGVSPEVFGAWFTGFGKTTGIVPQNDVRITQPSAGLKSWYDQRDAMLKREIEAVRKAAKPKEEPKKEEAKKEEPKKEEPAKEEPKKEEAKKEEPKKEEPAKEEPKKEEPAKEEPKKEEPKKEDPK